MLDAYIIERLKKETEEVQPLPLTLELPNFEEQEEVGNNEQKQDRTPEIAAVIRF